MKNKIILSTLIIAFVLCSLFYYHNHKKRPFRCDAQLVSHIEQDGSKIDLNLNANVIFTLHDESVISFNGSVTQDGREYLVSRRLFFTTNPSELEGVGRTKMTREQISKFDKLPAELWQQYIFQGTEFYTKMIAVNKNGFLFQGLSTPFFVCVPAKN